MLHHLFLFIQQALFKNNPDDVARYFYYHLVENRLFKGLFDKVVFAVLDRTKDENIINKFKQRFEL